jgi:hypothetical protein
MMVRGARSGADSSACQYTTFVQQSPQLSTSAADETCNPCLLQEVTPRRWVCMEAAYAKKTVGHTHNGTHRCLGQTVGLVKTRDD